MAFEIQTGENSIDKEALEILMARDRGEGVVSFVEAAISTAQRDLADEEAAWDSFGKPRPQPINMQPGVEVEISSED